MVLGKGLQLAGIGLAMGIAGRPAIMRVMTTLLFGVKPAEPAVFLAGAAILAARTFAPVPGGRGSV